MSADVRTPRRDIVVIGGSAGSLEALSNVVTALPEALPAAVFVVIHILPVAHSRLPDVLSRRGPLEAYHARHGDPLLRGRILVAPPDHHLVLHPDHVELSRGPRENSSRPAIDPLFRSAADAFGPRVCGVVLSGNLDDGSEGLRQVARAGGVAIVQDPDEALYAAMPRNALARCGPSCLVRPAAGIAEAIIALTAAPPAPDVRIVEGGLDDLHGPEATRIGAHDSDGAPTGLSCPECHGVLWTSSDPADPTLHCRIGHIYSLETLQAQRRVEVEGAINAAIRALHEDVSLAHHIAARAEHRGRRAMARRFAERAEAAGEHARVLESLIRGPMPLPMSIVEDEEHHET